MSIRCCSRVVVCEIGISAHGIDAGRDGGASMWARARCGRRALALRITPSISGTNILRDAGRVALINGVRPRWGLPRVRASTRFERELSARYVRLMPDSG